MEAEDDKDGDDYGDNGNDDDAEDDNDEAEDNNDGDDADHGTRESNHQTKTNVDDDNNRCPLRRLALDMICYPKAKQPLTMEFVLLLTNGTPPLHFACSQPCYSWFLYWKQTLEKLAALSAPKDWRRFHQGMLPLHCTCWSHAKKGILLWISEKYPEALCTGTVDTMDYPLHCYLSLLLKTATTRVPDTTTSTTTMQDDSVASLSPPLLPMYSFSTVQYLVKQYSAALHRANQSGWLLVHLAAMHNAPLNIVFYLACNNPESLLQGIF